MQWNVYLTCSKCVTRHNLMLYYVMTRRFIRLCFQKYFPHYRGASIIALPDDGSSISWNVASWKKLVHKLMNLLYYLYWKDKPIYQWSKPDSLSFCHMKIKNLKLHFFFFFFFFDKMDLRLFYFHVTIYVKYHNNYHHHQQQQHQSQR